jgi:hypothetical protein
MIGSGKSTYARKLAGEGYIICNDDDVVKLLHGGRYDLYSLDVQPLYKSVETNIITMALAMNLSAAIDRGVNVSMEGRRRWLGLAHSMEARCEAVIFPVCSPEEHARRRFEHDPRAHDYDYWLKVAREHLGCYDEPSLKEGFDALVRAPKWIPKS